jgi:hypothetical protein
VKSGIGETVIPMSLPKKPPQAMRIESRGVAAATDRFDRLMEAGRFKDARGLVRPLSRPAHGSKREGELIIAPLIPVPGAEDYRGQLMRSILAHTFISGCNADTRPTGRGKDGQGYGVVVDSHNAYWNILGTFRQDRVPARRSPIDFLPQAL